MTTAEKPALISGNEAFPGIVKCNFVLSWLEFPKNGMIECEGVSVSHGYPYLLAGSRVFVCIKLAYHHRLICCHFDKTDLMWYRLQNL